MDESAIKGQESNGSDADNRKSRYHLLRSNYFSRVTMIVSGYDNSLPEDDIKSLLSEHFSSCGEITQVYIPTYVPSEIRNKYAFIYIMGEDAEEKALQLNGSDVGGRNVVVKVMPPSTNVCNVTPEIAVRMAELQEKLRRNPIISVMVTGYDTSLPKDDIKSALSKHFSSCGEMDSVCIGVDRSGGLSNKAVLLIRGEGVAEKARELSGSDMGGWKADVVHCSTPIEIKFDRLYGSRKKAKMTRE